MRNAEKYLKVKLDSRKKQGNLRTLTLPSALVDFCSNDYLGFSRSIELKHKIEGLKSADKHGFIGSTGSRLLTGNSAYTEDLERHIARYHKAEAGLIFNSGYAANTGLFSAVPERGDTLILDELCHASVFDGARLSFANRLKFAHNNIHQLKERLKKAKGRAYVAVESVYSMNGDFSPLREIAALCEEFGAALIVDEAHATGLYGPKGEGRVVELGLEEQVFARICTFGKALGTHGAIVLGGTVLRDYLINYSRPFIFTTALSLDNLMAVHAAYLLLPQANDNKIKIDRLVTLFKDNLKNFQLKHSGPVQCIEVPGNEKVQMLADAIRGEGYDVRAIKSPTVPAGRERIRICIHAFNTPAEIMGLTDSLNKHLRSFSG